MRKFFLLTCAVLLLLCLSACGGAEKDSSVLVMIEEGEGFSVENNAQRVAPGEDAVFTLKISRGGVLLSADYRGAYEITERGSVTELRLIQPRVPARVRLRLAVKSGELRYEANGGAAPDGETSVVKSCSLNVHRRANTAPGTDMFAREGHTLVSWNTAPDGSGERVGLGSRVSLPGGELKLYAQWAAWSAAEDFLWEEEDGGVTVTGYRGEDAALVIPAELGGLPVRKIAAGAFQNCAADTVILPPGLEEIGDGAFSGCAMTELTLFDDLAVFSDACFDGCEALQSLHINAVEAPYGYIYRKESCYADKVDLLILSQGRKKLVFYGGCSIWYNLDGIQADALFGEEYEIIDLGLNGTVNSAVQMQIMEAFMEPGDILFHTPELSSRRQLMQITDMGGDDGFLWCGIENNYDLFALVDLRTVGGVFDTFRDYLSLKDRRTDYYQFYSDDYFTPYTDEYGCIPFYRSEHKDKLADIVDIRLERLTGEALQTLREYYGSLSDRGVRIYVSHACVNLDALPAGQEETLAEAGACFNEAVAAMGVAVPVSQLEDYLFRDGDFYDTNYHLLSEPARQNTALWMRDLAAQMVRDGIWEEAP